MSLHPYRSPAQAGVQLCAIGNANAAKANQNHRNWTPACAGEQGAHA